MCMNVLIVTTVIVFKAHYFHIIEITTHEVEQKKQVHQLTTTLILYSKLFSHFNASNCFYFNLIFDTLFQIDFSHFMHLKHNVRM